jgi:replicative DNA helicase
MDVSPVRLAIGPRAVADKYDFTKEFQLEILGTMLCAEVISNYRDCYAPESFVEPGFDTVASKIIEIFDRTGQPPSRTTLKETCPDSKTKEIVALIPVVKNKDAIIEKVVYFARKQAMKGAIRESVNHLIADDYESILPLIAAAGEVGRGSSDLGLLHDELTDGYETIDGGTTIATGMPRLTEALRGGFKPKRLYTFSGLPGAGKSQLLVNFAYYAMQQGKNVVYISNELIQYEVAQRFTQRISQVDDIHLIDDKEIVQARIKEFYKKSGRVIIRDYPPGEVSAKDIEVFITRIEKKINLKMNMIVIDYGDEMRSNKNFTGDAAHRLEQGQIWRDLKGLAKHSNMPVATACQSNASGYESDTLGMQQAAESQVKPRQSDAWITINQTQDEVLQNQMRLYIDKNRTGPRGITIMTRVDHARCTITERT